jgi:hypothetical protein
MRPIKTQTTNMMFTAPDCRNLPTKVTMDPSKPGKRFIVSIWTLTDHERKLIADGANIELTMVNSQPPVMLGTSEEQEVE